MDKYTKFILTMIAVGILGLNYHLFKGEIVSKAYAANNEVHKIAICEERGIHCASVTDSGWLRVLNYK
jgi:hypothetical protein|tara:strand:+ start:365 stop:568 length:204 start_codon:yes stop_codon:yes gene_type:complete